MSERGPANEIVNRKIMPSIIEDKLGGEKKDNIRMASVHM